MLKLLCLGAIVWGTLANGMSILEAAICSGGPCVKSADISCKDGDVRASEASCVSYQVCKDGQWAKSKCEESYMFNPEERKCVWISTYRCTIPEPIPTLKPDSAPKTHPTPKADPAPKADPTPAADHTPEADPTPAADPTCKEGEKKAVSGDCRKYQECVGGIFKDDSCFWPRKFDSVKKECVWYGATCA